MCAAWHETPEEARANLEREIAELVEARDKGLRADSDRATVGALARLRAYREKVLGEATSLTRLGGAIEGGQVRVRVALGSDAGGGSADK